MSLEAAKIQGRSSEPSWLAVKVWEKESMFLSLLTLQV